MFDRGRTPLAQLCSAKLQTLKRKPHRPALSFINGLDACGWPSNAQERPRHSAFRSRVRSIWIGSLGPGVAGNVTLGSVYRLSGPGLPPPPPPWYPAPPPGSQPPCPRTAPAPSGPAQPERTHANQREGTMENEPHQSRDRGTVCKEKRAILYGNEHVTMTLQPYHTYLCRTHCPTQAGRGQPKRPQAPPHRGGRGQGT